MHNTLHFNDLLATVPPADLPRHFGKLEWVELASGQTLHEAGATLMHVHFPVTAVVSLTMGLQDGSAAELALVGSEGVVGVSAFMGQSRTLGSAVVQSAGSCWRLPAKALEEAACAQPQLMRVLLNYAHSLYAQVAQLAVCGRHHALQARYCRWLLSCLDRSPGSELTATHDQIAHGLGVRREGVTVVAQRLLKAGLIDYRRGRISLLDRPGLEALSCECYTEVRDLLARGKTSLMFMNTTGEALKPLLAPGCGVLSRHVGVHSGVHSGADLDAHKGERLADRAATTAARLACA